MGNLSYDKNTMFLNNFTISSDVKIVTLYTHFMSDEKNVWDRNTHSHSYYELHIVLGGDCVMDVRREQIPVSRDSFLLIPPCEEHRFVRCSNDFFRFSLAFDIDFKYGRSDLNDVMPLTADGNCRQYVKSILTEYESRQTGFENIIASSTQCLIVEVMRRTGLLCAIADRKPKLSPDMSKALQFIDNNISQRITASDVSDAVYLSLRQLNRIFKENLGMTVPEYIRFRKLNAVKAYLKKTDLSIKEIAHLAGFENDCALCKLFKKKTGMSARTYRQS